MKKAKAFGAALLSLCFGLGDRGAASAQSHQQIVHQPRQHEVIIIKESAPAQAPAPQACAPVAVQRCDTGCGHHDCYIQWLKPWKCEDLEMKPVECKPKCHSCGIHGWLHDLLWCPPEEEKNGNGEKKNGDKPANGDKPGDKPANGEEKKNGNGEEEKEPPSPLMGLIQCYQPGLYDHMDCNKAKLYGWIQGGYTYNLDGPNRSQIGTFPNSFLGPNFNNRSNDFMLNQTWLRLEKLLDHDKASWGYTIDVNFGQDAADFNVLSIGMWENFTGDADTAIADDEDHGLDIPQFYAEAHIPGFITEKGMDIRVGRFFTLHGNELSPAIQTDFYSHSYGYFYSWPLTHTGVLATLHLTDTVDLMNGLVLGWDNVFADNNDKLSWHGMLIWNACDKRSSFWLTWIAGPEGIGRFDSTNDHWRVLVTADYSQKFGRCDEWKMVLHGAQAWDTSIFTGEDVEWYDYAANLFYTVNPQLILGLRAEWFRDDDGYRTGFADSFYEVTAGVTYKPFQNLRVRPEIRWDRASHTTPFIDVADKEMFTAAVDVIWEF